MAVDIQEQYEGQLLVVMIHGAFTREDYRSFTLHAKSLIDRFGRIRTLFDLRDFADGQTAASWESVKLDLRHLANIEAVAIVVDRRYESWTNSFCRPFAEARIRYFDRGATEQARQWVAAGLPVHA